MGIINTRFIRQVGTSRWAMRYAALQFRKRLLKRDGIMVLPTGSTMILPRRNQSATEIYITKANVDWGSEAIFARFADKASDFLDIGAHIGYYSSYLSPLVRRTYAFEPDQRNIPALNANALLASNVQVVQMAVSSRNGIAALHVGKGSEVSSLNGDGNGPTMDVPITTIDTFVSNRPDIAVTLIKTDIEGHDIEALRGMSETVTRHSPLILTECDGAGDLAKLCAAWGYRIFAFTRDRDTHETRFREMVGADLNERWYKMLFLVPPHLNGKFRNIQSQ